MSAFWRVELVRIGAVPPATLRTLRDDLENVVCHTVLISPTELDPSPAFDQHRQQYLVSSLMGMLARISHPLPAAAPDTPHPVGLFASRPPRRTRSTTASVKSRKTQHGTASRTPRDEIGENSGLVALPPGENHKVVGVTDVDLFLPVFTHVFGSAQLGGAVGVASDFRLRPEAAGDPADPHRLRQRLLKEVLHELGHTLGLLHCPVPWCAMSPSRLPEQVDLKDARLCAACAGESGIPAG